MQNSIPVLTLSVAPASAIAANRFVTPASAQAVAGDNTLGVARTACDVGALIPVDVLGTTVVEAGGSFTKGQTLKSDGSGKAILWATSGGKVAIALEDGASGRLVEVLLIPNAA